MGTPREHVEEIRRNKYQIGIGTISVSRDLRMAVKYLSTELYSKDLHFLMELIQNAEDNEYEEGVKPSLEFMLTSEDITGTGAPMTLLVLNNEKGFSRRNIDSICSIGDSSKTGFRKRGYIGEKGIGFKSVFLLTSQPHIFSNGYQVRFNEQPCPDCDIAYIVPEWVDEKPSVSDLRRIYGHSQLPATTIILPLKREKVDSVKNQLSSIHPELLLFLSKIRKLTVKEADGDHRKPNSLHAISISSEKDFVAKKNIDAESFTLHLTSSEEEGKEKECSYYMWRQRFPVKPENRVERRMEVDDWSITLAFPFGQRLNRGMMEAGIYSFLPTEMVTNFPFIIQADFILQSSREKIVLDDLWNKGILSCVPSAFMDAFTCLVKSQESAPLSTIVSIFNFLPIKDSSFSELNVVRESIKQKVVQENIVPSESFSTQLFFHKPAEVARISFWNILLKAKKQGVKFHNLSSHGKYILSYSFDKDKYNDVLAFLGVDHVDLEWYSKCIRSCNLVLGVDDDLYVELLEFIARNWSSCFKSTTMKNIPLLKYADKDGDSSLLSIEQVTETGGPTLCRSQDSRYASWLIKWSKEFKCAEELYFMLKDVQVSCSGSDSLLIWLRDHVEVPALTVYHYAEVLCKRSLCSDRRLLLAFTHFLYHSFSTGYLSLSEVEKLCNRMPLINNYGQIVVQRKGVLVPANGSVWVQLVNSNPWKDEGYVELHEDYLHSGYFGGQHSKEKELVVFLRKHVGASDIPDITPPNAALTCVFAPLTKVNAFLLLDWIRKLRSKGIILPSHFLESIKQGSWLKVSMSGCLGYRPPSQSFLHSSSWGNLLQSASVMIDIPVINQSYYDDKLSSYEEELKAIGVMSTYGEACKFIGDRLMSLASTSCLTKSNVMAMLGLIRFLREKLLSPDEFIASIKKGNWMVTSRGIRSPAGSVLYGKSWKVASQVSDIPFIDKEFYGNGLLEYKTELQLLDVVVEFNDNYQIVKDYLKSSSCINYLTSDAVVLMLKCIQNSTSPGEIVAVLKAAKCMKTSNGFRYPSECFLHDPVWGCILSVFDGFPCVDVNFYGTNILQYKAEMGQIGVVVDLDDAAKAFLKVFKEKTSRSSFTKENVFSFLACYRELKKSEFVFPVDFRKCITEERWLRTRLAAYLSPKDCILFGRDWEPISKITTLPFIDDSKRCYGKEIHEYKSELASMGVVIDIKNSARFVLLLIYFPSDVNQIAPASVFSLLDTIRRIKLDENEILPEPFLKKVSEKGWLKTTFGYSPPTECILFSSNWKALFSITDGPFIDEEHYGSSIALYEKELQAIGVTTDISAGVSLLAKHLNLLCDSDSIKRIYTYLEVYKWEPEGEASAMIWIPNGDDGEWASPADCVLYNKNNLFSSRLIVLEKYYDSKLLSFFRRAFDVKSHPSMDDYIWLWKDWEVSGYCPSHTDCCSFWSSVVKHWNPKIEKILSEGMMRVPASSSSSGEIQLVDKRDVFIPDDLLLKDLFCNSSEMPLFVWTPQPSHLGIPHSKLLEIDKGIGVRTISSSVVKAESIASLNVNETNLTDVFIRKGLVMLVLGFLADPALEMNPKSRHEAVKRLVDVNALETAEAITMRYGLVLSSGDTLNIDASRMIYWDRSDNKIFAQKLERSKGQKNVVEFTTNFAQVLSEGLLWDKEDLIPRLAELVKFGFLMNFDVDAVIYYLKSKNLQIFAEDDDFLASAYPKDRIHEDEVQYDICSLCRLESYFLIANNNCSNRSLISHLLHVADCHPFCPSLRDFCFESGCLVLIVVKGTERNCRCCSKYFGSHGIFGMTSE